MSGQIYKVACKFAGGQGVESFNREIGFARIPCVGEVVIPVDHPEKTWQVTDVIWSATHAFKAVPVLLLEIM